LLNLIKEGTISGRIAKEVFQEMFASGDKAEAVVERKGLRQVSNTDELTRICKEVITNNPSQVEEFRAGKQKIMGFLVGQIMRQTKGKANPRLVNSILKDLLSS
jgi:aspartyl-tRNA(Asn)/glutamyl-tRNA(Gln) amidotransferase subunit B